MMTTYTQEDEQDAAKALRRLCMTIPAGLQIARVVLDAVAPAIINRSKVEALREMADDLEQFEAFPGEEPQRLRDRADEIERTLSASASPRASRIDP